MQPKIFVSIKVQQSGFITLNNLHIYSFNSDAGYLKMQQKLTNWVRGF